MSNLSFDSGLRSFTINNDPDRVIRFDPTDIGMIDRLENAANKIQKMANNMPEDTDPRAAIRSLDTFARECVDEVFPEPVCDTVFGKACCVSVTPSGDLQVVSFLHSVVEEIKSSMASANRAAEKRQAKYLDKYQGNRQNFSRKRKRGKR